MRWSRVELATWKVGVAADWPEDPVVLILHADAMMNLQPQDDWEEDGVTPKGHAREMVAVLEQAQQHHRDIRVLCIATIV
jgi:hypothetical protein